jgi:hypothetical protein
MGKNGILFFTILIKSGNKIKYDRKMKALTVMTMLLILSVTGYAQTIGPQFRQFPPIKKELKFRYFSKPTLSELKPFKKSEPITNSLQKPITIHKGLISEKKPSARLKSGMPIMKPDSTINFHILAIRPDSAIHHHLQIRKLK